MSKPVIRAAGIALAVAVMPFGLRAEAKRPAIYRAQRVHGVVLARFPHATGWYPVRDGSDLFEGQMIQVTNGGSVTLAERFRRASGAFTGDRSQLTLTQPIVARLSADLLREVRVSTFFVDQVPTAPKGKAPITDIPLDLADAWERFAAVLTGTPPPQVPLAELSELERQGMAMGVSAKKLRLLTPVTNSLVQSAAWPAETKVAWARPIGAPRRYLLYVWKAGAARGAPQATTRKEFFTIKIAQPGSYFVQVTTTDGAWQSPAHAIHALTIESLEKQVDAHRQPVRLFDLSLAFPPDRFFQVQGQSAPATTLFAWKSASAAPGTHFVLKVTKDSGAVVSETRTEGQSALLKLVPGRYLWSVTCVESRLQSERRKLEIVDPRATRTTGEKRRLIQKLLSEEKHATVSFDSGL
jgi:hypothetical protein